MTRRIDRRGFLADCSATAVGLVLSGATRVRENPPFDVVIRDGAILDGTGGPPRRADIGIAGDTIAAVGDIPPDAAKRVIDAAGRYVAPGFIDIHSHSDEPILQVPTAESRVMQGITTEVTGNCGSSFAPKRNVRDGDGETSAQQPRAVEARGGNGNTLAEPVAPNGTSKTPAEPAPPDAAHGVGDVAEYLDRIDEMGVSINQALLLGQATIRGNEIGPKDRPLTKDELARVLQTVEAGLDQGAFGLSTGLEYAIGRFTPTEEIIAMARIVARYGGLYASHIRNEEAGLLDAIDEALDIGRAADVRVEVSHLKAAGLPNWDKQQPAIERIEAARAKGVDVLADAYPYTAYSTGLSIFLPSWLLDGGARAAVARLRDGDDRSRIRDEVAKRVAADPGSFDRVVISRVRSAQNRQLVGTDLTQIARGWNVEPVEALLRLFDEEGGDVSFIGHAMSEKNVVAVLAHPLVMIASDGVVSRPPEGKPTTRPHPRSYGTFPRVLARYVREKEVIDLQTAIKKMTSMPADQLRLRDRGRIARGMKADLAVFDAAEIIDRATFDDPFQFPAGISHVLVNGRPVVEAGRHTGALPGRALRRV